MKEIIRDFIQHGGDFNSTALKLFRWQVARNPEYGRICGNIRPTDWREIPTVPCSLFRDLHLCCFPPFAAKTIFRTSGTTGKRGIHRLQDTELYDLGSVLHMKRCIGGVPEKSISFVSTGSDSSLGHMCRLFSPKHKHFFVAGLGLLKEEGLRALKENQSPIFVPGTAFAFAELLHDQTDPIHFPEGSVVMITGGFKGRKHALESTALHEKIQTIFAGATIVSEYGMTELSSQLWSKENHGIFTPPPWMRVVAVDPGSGLPTDDVGQLRFYDLANHQTVMGVETRDKGKVYPNGTVKLLGRLPKAKPRGCSLTVEEYMESPKHHPRPSIYTGTTPLSTTEIQRLLDTLHGLSAQQLSAYAQGISDENALWGLKASLGALSVEGVQRILSKQRCFPKHISIVVSYGVFSSQLEWVFLALSTGAKVTIKAPSLDPHFSEFLCQKLQDAGFPIECIVERELPPSELIYVFGSNETVEKIHQEYPESTIKGYGHKFSIILCLGSPEEAAAIAKDLIAYDSRGCMAPAAIFTLSDPIPLKDALHQTLLEFEQTRPIGEIDPLMKPEWRYQTSLALATGQIFTAPSHQIRVLPAHFWSPVALPRVASLYHIHSISQLENLLQSRAGSLSTLGHSVDIP
ncbi:MAG: acyl-CoA reductase, partial [Myxococcota bacterium]|nr:acyl-CoA reductase [Myxococcota bacterium]